MTPTNDHQDNSWFIVPLLLFAVLLMAGQWLTATVAIFITGGGRVELELADAGRALIALPNNGSTPAQAWRPDIAAHLPGPFLYWPISAIIHTLLATAAYWLYRLMRMSPNAIDRRKRLGVDAQSRTARGRDLRPLTIRQPEPGRYRLGKARRRQLATEPPSGSIKKRATPGAVAVIAPSRSGKTYATINSANQWQGPAILSSVKRDLIDGTLAQRSAMGEVRFYDPKAVSGNKCSGWSPLARSKTRSGSVQMARMLLSANGHDNGQNGSFWASQAEGFLAALLWLAANTDHTMADVTYWVISVDQPANGEPGIAQGLLRALAKSDSELADEARDVQRQLQGIWNMEGRLLSSYYVTARLAVQPWTDPIVADTAITHEIDLDWLTAGDNTLYLVAPVLDQQVIAPALGGLIGDLVGQAIDLVDRKQQNLERPLLLVLDEAANTPITQLPQWASLLTGYRIQLVTIWQAKSQIDHIYGQAGDALLTNHRSKIFYGGMTDIATIDYLTTLLGNEHQPGVLSQRHDPDAWKAAPTAVALAPANVLRGIKVGQALLIHGSLPPIHLKTT